MQSVLDRIHQHAAGDAWRNKGFEDPQIEGWLDKLAGSIAKAAKMPDLKVPVRLAEVRPADPAPSGTVSQRLIVGKNLDLKNVRLQNSIVLADGHAEFDQAEGCVIVARGAVRLQRSAYCVIVSGLYVEVRWPTGGRMTRPTAASLPRADGPGSRAPTARSSRRRKARPVEIAQDALFVNAAIASGGLADSGGAKSLKVPDLPLEPLPANPLSSSRPWASSVPIPRRSCAIGPAFGRGRGGLLPVPVPGTWASSIRLGGRRYVAAIGEPILDESGQSGRAAPRLEAGTAHRLAGDLQQLHQRPGRALARQSMRRLLMTHHCHGPLALAVCLSAWLAASARADDPKLPPPKKDTLEAVLERIREHAAGEAWKQPGFQDDEIEKWLDKLIGSIAKASEINDLKLPVRLKDVRPREPTAGEDRSTRIWCRPLAVCHDADWKDASVDELDHSGQRQRGRGCGSAIRSSWPGESSKFTDSPRAAFSWRGRWSSWATTMGQPGREEQGSVIVSRGWADLGERAHGTIVAAEKGISATHTEGAVFVNAPAAGAAARISYRQPWAERSRGRFAAGIVSRPSAERENQGDGSHARPGEIRPTRRWPSHGWPRGSDSAI